MSRYDIKETADRIRAQRTICGYTQAQAARRLEIDRRSMSHIENGTKGCSVDLLIRIAEAYGVTLDYLLLGKSADSKIVKDRLGSLEKELPRLLQFYQNHIQQNQIGRATLYADEASALALAAYSRELRQLGQPISAEELNKQLCARVLPHQNHASFKNRYRELSAKTQAVLKQYAAPGIRSVEDKQKLAEAWLDLAVDFVKVTVKFQAEELEKWQRQQQESKQAMTM